MMKLLLDPHDRITKKFL
uniref:Uncharacterized protein n=1 Tax=Rhizophora mucronata TaxID=61149 RepID=A0A2P2IYK1_RHIMU